MTKFHLAALGIAASGLLAGAAPAAAVPAFQAFQPAATNGTTEVNANQYRDRQWRDGRGYRRNHDRNRGYSGPVWRGRDGRYHCRRNDGTTGLLIGGAVGGLIGNGIAGNGDRTLGTILGVTGGALLGREIDRSGSRCR